MNYATYVYHVQHADNVDHVLEYMDDGSDDEVNVGDIEGSIGRISSC